MPRGEKGKHFKPGQSGNLKGRPRTSPEEKVIRKLNRELFERIVNEFTGLDPEALKAKLKDPATPVLEVMVGSVIAKAIQTGDASRLEFLLTRMLGAPKQRIEHTGADGGPIRAAGPEALTDDQLNDRIRLLTQSADETTQ